MPGKRSSVNCITLPLPGRQPDCGDFSRRNRISIEASVGYYLQIGSWSLRDFFTDNSYKIAGGGIIATTTDLVRFGIALMEDRLIQEATRETLFTPLNLPSRAGKPVSYGLGFRSGMRDTGDQEIPFVSHGGSSVGGITYFLMYPSKKIVVAVTINITAVASDASPAAIAFEFADQVVTSAR